MSMTEDNRPGPQGAAEVENPDTGLTPSEQAEFDRMAADGSSPDDVSTEPDPPAPPPQVPGEPGAGDGPQGADDDDEGDGDDEAGEGEAEAGAQPQPGAQQQQPGQQAQPGQAGQQQKKVKARVSLNKLKLAEKERDDQRTENARMREMLARADERMQLINQALASPEVLPGGQQQPGQQQADADPEPDPEEDIFEWAKWSRRRTERLEQQLTGVVQGNQEQRQQREFDSQYVADVQRFATQEPNFFPAYAHLMAARTQSLALYYFGKDLSDPNAWLTPAEQNHIKNQIAKEERGYAAAAVKHQQSPAKYIYSLARGMGYQPRTPEELAALYAQQQGGQQQGDNQPQPGQQGGQPQPKPGQQQAQRQNGAGQQQKPAKQQVPSVAEELARVARGQDAAMSLSNGGGVPQSTLTAEQLANMPQHEFDRLMNTLSEAEQNRLLGA